MLLDTKQNALSAFLSIFLNKNKRVCLVFYSNIITII